MMSTDLPPLTYETTEALPAIGPALLPLPRGPGEEQFNKAMRICPYAFLRSAVFGVVGKGKRKHFDNELLASAGEYTIRFTGLQLDQTDLDVWLALVHLLQHQSVGGAVTTTHLELLTMLGKADSGQNRATLQRQLTRLRATAVSVRIASGSSYLGGLIDAVEGGKTLVVRLDPRVIELFTGKRFARMRAAVRLELPPLSSWLYGYFSSHIEPAPVTVEELRRLCGSNAADLDDFRSSLRNALKHLKRVCDECEENFNWRIDRTGLVHADWLGSQKHIRWSKKARARSPA